MDLDLLWLMISTILVLMMQAGFLCLESGLTRAKNSINVAIKNLADLILVFLLWWLFGFGLAFGESEIGLWGSDHFLLEIGNNDAKLGVFFLFQAMFCATAVTIISGAIAERTKFNAYLAIAIIVTLFTYPIFAHWVWGGALSQSAVLLASWGFVDFAGATVVHSLGGWVALAAVIVIGPRSGVFSKKNGVVPPSNLTLATLASVFFLLGWIGFNGGSTLAFNNELPKILINTILAAMAGGVAAYLVSQWLRHPNLQLSVVPVNGLIAGLVAITATCHAVDQTQAFVIGAIGGLIYVYGSILLLKLKIDDAIGAIPVHLFAGIWGTLAVGLFADLSTLNTDMTRIEQIGVQCLGIAICGLWAFGTTFCLLKGLNYFYRLRVTARQEHIGLNVAEHGAKTDLVDFLVAVNEADLDEDLSKRLPVEPFTEVGQIAQQYNKMISRAEQAVHKTTTIVKDVQAGIVTLNASAWVLSVNPAADKIFAGQGRYQGKTFEQLIQVKSIYEVAVQREITHKPWPEILKENGHIYLEGQPKNTLNLVYLDIVITNSSYNDKEYICLVHDITQQKSAEEALFQEKEKAKTTLDSIGDGVISTSPSGEIQYINQTAEKLTGWRQADALGKKLHSVFCAVNNLTEHPSDSLIRQIKQSRDTLITEQSKLLFCRDGQVYAIRYTAAPIFNRAQQLTGIVIVFQDVTHTQRIQRKLNYQATHDALTDLYNRREFDNRLRHLIDNIVAGEGQARVQHVLIYIDLDQFKIVNDVCGHAAGDQLLKQVSQHMQRFVRAQDMLARLGGDEFAILLYNCPLAKGQAIAEKIRQVVRDYRFAWQGKEYAVTTSIGIVAINENSRNLAEVVNQADSACYTSKKRGKNQVNVYQPADNEIQRHKQQVQWVSRLQQAIDQDNGFELYFQKIVAANPDDPSLQFEILLRLRDENHELIPPNAFLPSAERYNLIQAIDKWVIQRTFAWLATHRSRLPHNNMKCAINLSGKSLNDAEVIQVIDQCQAKYQIAPHIICFEITETAAIDNLSLASQFIIQLKNKGFRFALDDFGAGLSSFNYLKNLPVDFLKIDGSFVRQVDQDPLDQAMVQSVANIGKTLGIKTIAEYVASPNIVSYLQAAGVDYLQGYHIHKPEPLDNLAKQFMAKSANQQEALPS
ncbi:PAS domain S-box protein [Saccharobesus litoralis]|uniref:PAS domain S-box protein n=1 Tax=Saccharobesus litoralis TaxID=2172099 RepID=A0A2S0VQG0_9ALTE|nr:ammonium transporter [Saccharobesus litoralis]AWB66444.1 PAS domain S-box protein [Saccharobesus litoralis]